jgi:hypothetical protein
MGKNQQNWDYKSKTSKQSKWFDTVAILKISQLTYITPLPSETRVTCTHEIFSTRQLAGQVCQTISIVAVSTLGGFIWAAIFWVLVFTDFADIQVVQLEYDIWTISEILYVWGY